MPKGALISNGRTAEVFSWDERTVLKLYHPRIPDLWIEQERRVGRFVWEAALPVPALQGTIRDEDRTGLLWERISGKSLLQGLLRHPFRLRKAAEAFTQLHQRIHAVEARDLPPVEVWLDQILRHSPFLTPAEKSVLIRQVDALPAGNHLLHMDFHPGNILEAADGPKVIDWLMAMRGPAEADVARTLLLLEYHLFPQGLPKLKAWIVRRLLREFRLACREAYRKQGSDFEALERWTLPLAAARLAEPIGHEERLALLKLVRNRLAAANS